MTRYSSLCNIIDFEHAAGVAKVLTDKTGDLWIATDAGPGVYPRYDVVEAPKVGEKVSYAFNGDYYPCGEIVSISESLRVIKTSSGKRFYRRKLTGAWINNGTWCLVPGHVSRLNPEF